MLHFKNLRSRGALFVMVAVAALAILLFSGVQPALAQSGETGDVCAGVNGAGSCSANDLILGTLAIVQTVEPCTFVGDTGTFIFDATFNAGSNTRYNASMYISLDGDSANTGTSCYHDYLNPVADVNNTNYNPLLGPFYNAGDGDMCGDVQPNSTIQYRTSELTIACTDGNGDGVVDAINTCTGWQQNSTETCQDVTGATIEAPSKCSCEAVPIPAAVIRKIRVDKVTVPGGDPQSFNFTLKDPSSNTLNTFSLTDAAAPWVSGVLPAANGYSVVETLPAGWVQTSATCTNGNTTYSPTNIDLTLNREVVCTFTNSSATITVDKDTVDLNGNPINSGHQFQFMLGDTSPTPIAIVSPITNLTANPWFQSQNNATNQTFRVMPGTYTLGEIGSYINQPGNWQLIDIECVDPLSNTVGTWGGYNPNGTMDTDITLPVVAGDSVTCTFTNKVGPLAVTLAEFYAEQVDDYVQVTWETASELNNRGFNLYRATAPAGPFTRLNQFLIPSQSQGSPGGFTYTWQDRDGLVAGTDYYYQLEDVATGGATTLHGPVSVSYVGPTAVTLSSVQANPVATPYALPLAGTLLALLVPLAGALAVRRRRM